MGVGDWIMATSQVRAINEQTGKLVAVVDLRGRIRWAEGIFNNNPRLAAARTARTAILLNSGGARPYIAGQSATRWQWRLWDIAPGELFFDAAERRRIDATKSAAVLIEPNTKVEGSNKAWLWDRWQAVAHSGVADFVQVGPPGTRALDGVRFIETPTFRQALLVLAACRGYVGTEGGLHHAAAALRVPAVVLWSHFIAPQFTGYATHTNIRHSETYCGLRVPCLECRASMAAITVDEVINAIKEIDR